MSLCAPLPGRADLTEDEDVQSTLRLGVFGPVAHGNQDWVRQYDGRTFQAPAIELLKSMGYRGPFQYNLGARNLGIGNDDVLAVLAYKNVYNVKLSTSELTHRLARIPAVDPFEADTPADGGNDFVDLTPLGNFSIDRRVNDFALNMMPGSNQVARLRVGVWQQFKWGTRQLLFRAREDQPGVISNRDRGGVGLPINNITEENSLGGDFRLGNSTVLNYKFLSTSYSENAGRPTASQLDFLPLNQLTTIGSATTSQIVKMRGSASDRLHFTGVYIARFRTNQRVPAATAVNEGFNSTNLAAIYLPAGGLAVTARYRHYKQQDNVMPVFDPQGELENQAVTKHQDSLEVESTYAGIRRAFFKLSYENRTTSRDITPTASVHPEPEHPEIDELTHWSIWRGSFRYYPGVRFSLLGNIESWSANNPGYPGLPTARMKVNANATYTILQNLVFYADFSRINDRNDQIPVPFDQIPAQATDDANAELRQDAVGEGYKNLFTTGDVGIYYALTDRLSLDLNYALIYTDAQTLWVIGVDPAYLPHLAPDNVPYTARNNQWSLGATYAVAPRTRVYARIFFSTATGHSTIDPTIFPDSLGPTWSPVDVDEHRLTFGASRETSDRDTLSLDFSTSKWTDNIDTGNDGEFNLTRLAWSRHY